MHIVVSDIDVLCVFTFHVLYGTLCVQSTSLPFVLKAYKYSRIGLWDTMWLSTLCIVPLGESISHLCIYVHLEAVIYSMHRTLSLSPLIQQVMSPEL